MGNLKFKPWKSSSVHYLTVDLLRKLENQSLGTVLLSNKSQKLLSVFQSLKYTVYWSIGIYYEWKGQIFINLLLLTSFKRHWKTRPYHIDSYIYCIRQFLWHLCLIMLKQLVYISCLIFAVSGRFFTK